MGTQVNTEWPLAIPMLFPTATTRPKVSKSCVFSQETFLYIVTTLSSCTLLQIGVLHHRSEECSNLNHLCDYLQHVMQIADVLILNVHSERLHPGVDGHCVARTTAPYISYLAGKDKQDSKRFGRITC